MKDSQNAFDALIEADKKRRVFISLERLVQWDQQTYLPDAGHLFRGEQMQLMSSMAHEQLTAPAFSQALSKLIDLESGTITADNLTNEQQAACREWRRDVRLATKLPTAFVGECSALSAAAREKWLQAKQKNDFTVFQPYLEQLFAKAREKADLIGYETHPYDALVDEYEPGMTAKKLSNIFEELKTFLIELRKDVATPSDDPPFLHKTYPSTGQLELCNEIAHAMGVDSTRCRLDVAHHPFCMPIHSSDVRMTTHSDHSSFFNTISGTLHEAGHSLYELGLPQEKFGTPLCESVSLGMHESQSRFWECFIGLSRPFTTYLHSLVSNRFPDQMMGVSEKDLYHGLIAVRPSCIRIHADEVTYCLHVIIRFELERALIEGTLTVKDLPDAWNEKMHRYLGITPSSYAEGCLQDIHWSLGAIGYFPTYALGNLYAGCLFETFTEAHPDWELKVATGDMHFIRDFLEAKIHRFGRQLSPMDLIEQATGNTFTPKKYMQYLSNKYR